MSVRSLAQFLFVGSWELGVGNWELGELPLSAVPSPASPACGAGLQSLPGSAPAAPARLDSPEQLSPWCASLLASSAALRLPLPPRAAALLCCACLVPPPAPRRTPGAERPLRLGPGSLRNLLWYSGHLRLEDPSASSSLQPQPENARGASAAAQAAPFAHVPGGVEEVLPLALGTLVRAARVVGAAHRLHLDLAQLDLELQAAARRARGDVGGRQPPPGVRALLRQQVALALAAAALAWERTGARGAPRLALVWASEGSGLHEHDDGEGGKGGGGAGDEARAEAWWRGVREAACLLLGAAPAAGVKWQREQSLLLAQIATAADADGAAARVPAVDVSVPTVQALGRATMPPPEPWPVGGMPTRHWTQPPPVSPPLAVAAEAGSGGGRLNGASLLLLVRGLAAHRPRPLGAWLPALLPLVQSFGALVELGPRRAARLLHALATALGAAPLPAAPRLRHARSTAAGGRAAAVRLRLRLGAAGASGGAKRRATAAGGSAPAAALPAAALRALLSRRLLREVRPATRRLLRGCVSRRAWLGEPARLLAALLRLGVLPGPRWVGTLGEALLRLRVQFAWRLAQGELGAGAGEEEGGRRGKGRAVWGCTPEEVALVAAVLLEAQRSLREAAVAGAASRRSAPLALRPQRLEPAPPAVAAVAAAAPLAAGAGAPLLASRPQRLLTKPVAVGPGGHAGEAEGGREEEEGGHLHARALRMLQDVGQEFASGVRLQRWWRGAGEEGGAGGWWVRAEEGNVLVVVHAAGDVRARQLARTLALLQAPPAAQQP